MIMTYWQRVFKMACIPLIVALLFLGFGWVMTGWILIPVLLAKLWGGLGFICGFILWWIGTSMIVNLPHIRSDPFAYIKSSLNSRIPR